ncbi:MAG: M64 family metallopeptidase [Bacteroidota bacterium]
MKRSFSGFIGILLLAFVNPAAGQSFDRWFEEGAMRLDLVFTGTAEETTYSLESLRREPFYSGPTTGLLDSSGYGDHQFEVRDAATGTLMFSHTYNTLFREWQTTSEAEHVSRAFSHVIRFPWPEGEVVVEVYDRDDLGIFRSSWRGRFDPASIFADPTIAKPFETVDLEINGPPESKVDILFLAEGYTRQEMDKFIADARRSAGYIFSSEPFKSNRSSFNIRAVKSASKDSGTDIPGDGVWKNTVMNSSFYTFGMERYLTTSDFKTVCDVAANAHYDQLYILVNTDKYGGGGIYNFYSISAVDNTRSRTVVTHEFGHAFAALADEYFTSKITYNDFFNLEVEPWNPNLTTLVDFDSKWRSMVEEGIPVPTPPEERYKESVGVYEGGGYVTHGVYRPMIDCMMHTHNAPFCPVCKGAIEEMIRRRTGK